MQLIADAIEACTSHARMLKEDHVREVGRRGLTQLSTIVETWRGDNPVAMIFAPPSHEVMRSVVELAAAGFSADVVAVTVESGHDELIVAVANRSDDLACRHLPYQIKGRRVTWFDPHEDRDPKGVIVTALREVMSVPTAAQHQVHETGAASYEQVEFDQDMDALSGLRKMAGVTCMLFARSGSERHQLLRERRLERGDILNPGEWE